MIKQIAPHVFIGSGQDFEDAVTDGAGFDLIISAAKEPWHREALGYKGRGAPKEDPEYLVAYRPGRVILNFVDAADVKYISEDCIAAALEELHAAVADGRDVLVHCNLGESRAPTIGLLYVLSCEDLNAGFKECENGYEVIDRYTTHFYPDYNPGDGLRDFVLDKWSNYLA